MTPLAGLVDPFSIDLLDINLNILLFIIETSSKRPTEADDVEVGTNTPRVENLPQWNSFFSTNSCYSAMATL